MVREAFAALQRNYPALLIYLVIAVGANAIRVAVDVTFIQPREEDLSDGFLNAYRFSADLISALTYALAQTIAFARFGREIDQPLWKSAENDWEALKNFYGLWLLLDLTIIAMARIIDSIAPESGPGPLTGLLFYLWIFAAIFAVPLGACIMFYGKLGAAEIKKSFETLSNQFPRTFIVLLIAFLTAIILLSIRAAGELPDWTLPALTAVEGVVDCLIFCCVWLICMYERDEESEDDDFDF